MLRIRFSYLFVNCWCRTKLGRTDSYLEPAWMRLAKFDAASAEPTGAQIEGDGKTDEAFLACGEVTKPLNVRFPGHGSPMFPFEYG